MGRQQDPTQGGVPKWEGLGVSVKGRDVGNEPQEINKGSCYLYTGVEPKGIKGARHLFSTDNESDTCLIQLSKPTLGGHTQAQKSFWIIQYLVVKLGFELRNM